MGPWGRLPGWGRMRSVLCAERRVRRGVVLLVVLGLVPVPGVPGRPDVPGRPVLVVGVLGLVLALAGEPEPAGAFVLELVGVLGLVPAVPGV